jgi:hypothetical protein
VTSSLKTAQKKGFLKELGFMDLFGIVSSVVSLFFLSLLPSTWEKLVEYLCLNTITQLHDLEF